MNQYEARTPLHYITPYGLAKANVRVKTTKAHQKEGMPTGFYEFESFATWSAEFHRYGSALFEILTIGEYLDDEPAQVGDIHRFLLKEVTPVWRWETQPKEEEKCQ